MKIKILWIIIIYTTWFIGSLVLISISPTFSEVGHLKKGCYQTDALLLYLQCNGFIGSKVLMVLVNIPYITMQITASTMGSISGALLLLVPSLYIPWYFIKHNKKVKRDK